MTLLVTAFAAIITTVIWYKNAPDSTMQLGTLCLMYWGASIMLNDLYLGLSVVALGLIIWLVILLIKDPRGVVKKAILK